MRTTHVIQLRDNATALRHGNSTGIRVLKWHGPSNLERGLQWPSLKDVFGTVAFVAFRIFEINTWRRTLAGRHQSTTDLIVTLDSDHKAHRAVDSDPIPPSPTQRFPFFRLPRELRDLVYHFLWSETQFTLQYGSGRRAFVAYYGSEEVARGLQSFPKWLLPSATLRKEGLEQFYRVVHCKVLQDDIRPRMTKVGVIAWFQVYRIRKLDLGQVKVKCSSWNYRHSVRPHTLNVYMDMSTDVKNILCNFQDVDANLVELALDFQIYECSLAPPVGPFDKIHYDLEFLRALPQGLRHLHIKITKCFRFVDTWQYQNRLLTTLQAECLRTAKDNVITGMKSGLQQRVKTRTAGSIWCCEVWDPPGNL